MLNMFQILNSALECQLGLPSNAMFLELSLVFYSLFVFITFICGSAGGNNENLMCILSLQGFCYNVSLSANFSPLRKVEKSQTVLHNLDHHFSSLRSKYLSKQLLLMQTVELITIQRGLNTPVCSRLGLFGLCFNESPTFQSILKQKQKKNQRNYIPKGKITQIRFCACEYFMKISVHSFLYK